VIPHRVRRTCDARSDEGRKWRNPELSFRRSFWRRCSRVFATARVLPSRRTTSPLREASSTLLTEQGDAAGAAAATMRARELPLPPGPHLERALANAQVK
jgi:hypothetical protein